MFRAFCYCCQTHVTCQNGKEFRDSGHVNDRDTAKSKYLLNTNRLPRKYGRKQRGLVSGTQLTSMRQSGKKAQAAREMWEGGRDL